MESNNVILILGIAVTMVVLATMVYIMVMHKRMDSELKTTTGDGSNGQSTYFLDEGEDERTCDICYGKIGENAIAECSCGRVFHDACASPTEACPYCRTGYASMRHREPSMTRCPACGRFMKAGICTCGALVSRKDGTFPCTCGGRVDVSRPLCRRCGAIYQSVTTQRYKNPR